MPRAGLSTDSVVDAAAVIADAEGLEALTLAGVAAAVGVRTPSLYSHVGGFADLCRRLGTRGALDLAHLLARAAAGRTRLDALRAAAGAYRRYAAQHPGSYAAAQRAPDPADAVAVAACAQVVDVLRALLAGYDLRDADAVHAIRAVRCALHGFVTLEFAGGFGMPESIEQSFARMIDMLDAGLDAPVSAQTSAS